MDADAICTVTDLERMTPDQRYRLVHDRTSTDLSDVAADFLERARFDGRHLLVQRGVVEP
jgi:hypothetical protein